MEIHWNVGNTYPVEITIRNYWAPVNVMDDGTIRVAQKEATDRVEKTMRIGEAEWLNHLRTIRDDMTTFEVLHSKETRNDAMQTLLANRA